MNPIHIIVHRGYGEDAYRAFTDTLERLYIPGTDISYDKSKLIIEIGNYMTFSFRSGDVYRMSGMRCNLFNTDTIEAQKYLCTRVFSNNKINNPEIANLGRFIDELVKSLKESEDKNNEQKQKVE